MRHGLTLAGHRYALRPVDDADAPLIATLRGDPALNRHLHATEATADAQRRWLAAYHERPGDYYFAVMAREGGAPEGLVSVYDIDEATREGEWGRWILRKGSPAAVESAWLIYRVAFELLQLRAVHCRTVAANASVVSFHDSCGIAERTLLPGAVLLDGRPADMVRHRVTTATWPALDAKLGTLAAAAARRAQRVHA